MIVIRKKHISQVKETGKTDFDAFKLLKKEKRRKKGKEGGVL